MSFKLYYTAPSERIFEDIRRASKQIWSTYSDEYGYRSEKMNIVMNLMNVKDNYMYMFAMFDWNNQQKLLKIVEPTTRERILKALK